MSQHAILYIMPELVQKPAEFDMEDLPALGWLQITDIGEENMYFLLENGQRGFCKILR